ncbi:unnamed protein product [Linum trigynum]|uniref:Uncharacterized protein n=1 Tax=Linum trigynum TaxID=586398 RepID=A0AAV2F723_9ROSI
MLGPESVEVGADWDYCKEEALSKVALGEVEDWSSDVVGEEEDASWGERPAGVDGEGGLRAAGAGERATLKEKSLIHHQPNKEVEWISMQAVELGKGDQPH